MARQVKVDFSGPLFETSTPQKLDDAIAGFLEQLGLSASGILMGFISAGGFVKSGAFLAGVEARQVRTRGVGYVKVTDSARWEGTIKLGHSGAVTKRGKARMTVQSVATSRGGPPLTWFEAGTRSGVRLRSGIYGFRKTRQAVNAFDLQGMALKAITPVLTT